MSSETNTLPYSKELQDCVVLNTLGLNGHTLGIQNFSPAWRPQTRQTSEQPSIKAVPATHTPAHVCDPCAIQGAWGMGVRWASVQSLSHELRVLGVLALLLYPGPRLYTGNGTDTGNSITSRDLASYA